MSTYSVTFKAAVEPFLFRRKILYRGNFLNYLHNIQGVSKLSLYIYYVFIWIEITEI